MKIRFSNHAAQRMTERLNRNVNINMLVDISTMFKFSGKFIHDKTGKRGEYWFCKDPKNRIVLVIDTETKIVVTIMTQGPVVDAIYRNI